MKEHTLLVQRIEQTNKGSLRTTYLKVVHEDENVRFHFVLYFWNWPLMTYIFFRMVYNITLGVQNSNLLYVSKYIRRYTLGDSKETLFFDFR